MVLGHIAKPPSNDCNNTSPGPSPRHQESAKLALKLKPKTSCAHVLSRKLLVA